MRGPQAGTLHATRSEARKVAKMRKIFSAKARRERKHETDDQEKTMLPSPVVHPSSDFALSLPSRFRAKRLSRFRHLSRFRASFLLPFAFLALFPAPSRAALISRSTEISMGREAAQEYERTTSVDSDPVLAARVQRIGNRLIAVGETPPYPFELHEGDTNEMNAFSLPGGFVYFYRGLA